MALNLYNWVYNIYVLQEKANWVKIATIVVSLCFVVFFAIGPGKFSFYFSDAVGIEFALTSRDTHEA